MKQPSKKQLDQMARRQLASHRVSPIDFAEVVRREVYGKAANLCPAPRLLCRASDAYYEAAEAMGATDAEGRIIREDGTVISCAD